MKGMRLTISVGILLVGVALAGCKSSWTEAQKGTFADECVDGSYPSERVHTFIDGSGSTVVDPGPPDFIVENCRCIAEELSGRVSYAKYEGARLADDNEAVREAYVAAIHACEGPE